MSEFSAEWETPEFGAIPELAENAVWRLRGCDDTILRKTLQETYRDFCKRSAALRTWRRVELSPHDDGYPIPPVLSAEIDCVTQILVDGRFPFPRRFCRVVGDPPVLFIDRRRLRFEPPPPPPPVFVPRGEFLVPAPPPPPDPRFLRPRGGFAMVEAVEVPHLDEERAPQPFLRRYGDAIVAGALARMMSMEGRPWSDGEQSRQFSVQYHNELSEARLRSMRGSPAANAGKTNALDMSSMV